MIKRLSLFFIYLCLGVFSGNFAKAQTIKLPSRLSVDSLIHPVVMDDGERILSFEKRIQSIGIMSECDSPKSISFSFRNVGTKATKIREVKTFCGCTTAAYDMHVVDPDDVGEIVVKYNPKNKIGTVDERIYVYTIDSKDSPVACLRIFGEVKDDDPWRHLPKRMGNLRMKRSLVDFMIDSKYPFPSERIWCGNSGNVPLKIVAKDLPDFISFRMEPEVLQPNEEGDMIITVMNEKLDRKEMFDFQLFLEGVGEDAAKSFIRVRMRFVEN
jgi:hypothetical protein